MRGVVGVVGPLLQYLKSIKHICHSKAIPCFLKDTHPIYVRQFFTFYCQNLTHFLQINLALECICLLLALHYKPSYRKRYQVASCPKCFYFSHEFLFSLKNEGWKFQFSNIHVLCLYTLIHAYVTCLFVFVSQDKARVTIFSR